MFLKNSRYYGLPTVTARDAAGSEVVAVKLRPLPEAGGDPRAIQGHDKIDVMADARFGDAARRMLR